VGCDFGWSPRLRPVVTGLVSESALIALFLATATTASAWGGMVVPSSGYVTTLSLESPYPELWFLTYYDRTNVLQATPANGAHLGVDISNGFVNCQNPVYSAANGTVAWTGFDTGGFGWSVVIAHGTNVGGSGRIAYTVYGHLGTAGTSAGTSQSCVVATPNQVVTATRTVIG
jgi:murein DD-endopeptidase MepM/ murein hydrolase activator NlpD